MSQSAFALQPGSRQPAVLTHLLREPCLGQASMIRQRVEPLVTVAPTCARRLLTVPARWAVSGCSIFIASSTTTRSPACTASPSATATLTIVPCIGEVSASPDGPLTAPPPLAPPRRTGLAGRLG